MVIPTRVNYRELKRVMPAPQCSGMAITTGERCERKATRGATVCYKHGAGAPQVRAKATERVTLAVALARGDRRHPKEILADNLHLYDTLGRQLIERLAEDGPVTVEMVNAIMEAARGSSSMAKLVLEVGADPDTWEKGEVNRLFGAVIAEICREFARRLGHDPASQAVADAFQAAMQRVVHGRRTMPKMIEGSVQE